MNKFKKPLVLIASGLAAAGCTAAMFLAPSEAVRFAAKLTLFSLVACMLIAAFARWRFGARLPRSLVRRALIFLAALTVITGVSELAARAAYRDRIVIGDSYLARQAADRQAVRLNSLGFREKELVPGAPGERYRIAVLGDSVTWGEGVARSQRFTEQLDRHLNASVPRFEVLNFGHRGANLLDHIARLENLVLEFEPDFVLLQWSIDDFESFCDDEPYAYTPLMPSAVLADWLLRHSAAYYLLNRAFERAQVALGFVPAYEDHLDAHFGDRNSGASVAANEALDRFIHLAAMRRVGVGIVAFPPLIDGAAVQVRTPADYLANRVMGACTAYGLTCLDLRGVFNVAEGPESLRIDPYSGQPNARAHALAAEAIALVFGEDWRLASLRRLAYRRN